MSRLNGARRLAAIPVASFVLVFGATLAYYEASDAEQAPPPVRAKAAAAPEPPVPPEPSVTTGKERVLVSIRGPDPAEAYLHSVRLDGSGLVRIGRASGGERGQDLGASWSPDGRRMVFWRDLVDRRGEHSVPRMYTAAADGSKVRPLSRRTAGDYNPAWSPDGTRIAFGRIARVRGSDATDIWTVRPDGGGLRGLTEDPDIIEDLPTWSPDASRIAYEAVRRKGGSWALQDLWVMNDDGSDRRPLLDGPHQDAAPAWSPDGSRIAFVRDGQLATVNPDGTDVRVLTRGRPEHSRPVWSPDGKRILFTRDPGDVLVANADGSGIARVPLERDAFAAAWGPAR